MIENTTVVSSCSPTEGGDSSLLPIIMQTLVVVVLVGNRRVYNAVQQLQRRDLYQRVKTTFLTLSAGTAIITQIRPTFETVFKQFGNVFIVPFEFFCALITSYQIGKAWVTPPAQGDHIKKIEEDVKGIKKDVAEIKKDVTEIRENIKMVSALLNPLAAALSTGSPVQNLRRLRRGQGTPPTHSRVPTQLSSRHLTPSASTTPHSSQTLVRHLEPESSLPSSCPMTRNGSGQTVQVLYTTTLPAGVMAAHIYDRDFVILPDGIPAGAGSGTSPQLGISSDSAPPSPFNLDQHPH